MEYHSGNLIREHTRLIFSIDTDRCYSNTGTATALYLGSTNSDFPTERVLGFTAGGFIYISLVEISPNLFHHENTWLQNSIELGAVISGIGFMSSMIEFEEAMGV